MSLWAEAKRRMRGGGTVKPDLYYRVAVLGGNNVGKTSIISQFTQKIAPDNSASSYFINREVFETSDANLHLDILDTSGVKQLSMLEIAIGNSDAFLLVYSIDDSESYEYAQTLWKRITEVKMSLNVPVVFVANKTDLTRVPLGTPEIPCGVCPVEITALSYDDVCEAFKQVVGQLNRNVSLTSELQRRRKSEGAVHHNRRNSIREFIARIYHRSSI